MSGKRLDPAPDRTLDVTRRTPTRFSMEIDSLQNGQRVSFAPTRARQAGQTFCLTMAVLKKSRTFSLNSSNCFWYWRSFHLWRGESCMGNGFDPQIHYSTRAAALSGT